MEEMLFFDKFNTWSPLGRAPAVILTEKHVREINNL
jgi:hypothetical protein